MAQNTVIVSHSPHLHDKKSTPFIMKHVIIALIPATIASIVFFKYYAVLLISNCVLSAIVTELIVNRIRQKPHTIGDYSAALTGLLLALILPPSTKWYAATMSSVFAIIVGKQLFGGLGANIFNPALIGRAFLMAAYPKMMTSYIAPFTLDAISNATPLALRKFNGVFASLQDLFWGNVGGSLGETSAVCLIIGGIYLLIRKIADWRIPLTLLATTIVIAGASYAVNPAQGSILFHLLSGGLLLGAFFMATDPVTTPTTKLGRYIFAVGCGAVIMIIRYFSGLPEGTMYAILFMNALTPLINRYTAPNPFGYRYEYKER